MARERNNKEVKTHLDMVVIYDKFSEDFFAKQKIRLTYTQISEKIAERIKSAGGVLI